MVCFPFGSVNQDRALFVSLIVQLAGLSSRDGEREVAQGRLRALEKRAVELKQKQSAAVAAQIAGVMAGVNASAYTETLTGLQTDLRAVTGELVGVRQTANTVPPVIDADAVASFVARAMATVEAVLMSDAIPVHEKNAALRGIVDRVLLHRGEII